MPAPVGAAGSPPAADQAGAAFVDPEQGEGTIALAAAPDADDALCTLSVRAPAWSVDAPLSSGQLHRLANALTGRGRRSAVRPLTRDAQEPVHLAGSPEALVVTFREQVLTIPAGPDAALGVAMRHAELLLTGGDAVSDAPADPGSTRAG